MFRRLAELMGCAGMAADPRFATHQARGRHMGEIDRIIGEWTQDQASAELLDRLHRAGVPAGLVYEPRDMMEDPQFLARDSVALVKDERHGELAMQAVVPKLSDTPGQIRWAGQALGADTEAVLTDLLGLGAQRIEQLRDQAVI